MTNFPNAKREEVLTMSANTETTGGPPKGYGECVSKCGRWAYMCGGGPIHCNACVPSSATYMAMRPDWTPPIAAPAAHVERRKGQRWKMVSARLTMEGTLGDCGNSGMGMRWMLSDVVRSDGVSIAASCFYFERWDQPEYTMTLLADAPPEPAKLMCSDCSSFGTTGKHWFACPNAPKKSPPTQEAPKAAPALEWSFTDKEGRDHWFATGNERDAASRAYWSWMAEQAGKPYAGPERLPRPQLAADWSEDCLPTVWR